MSAAPDKPVLPERTLRHKPVRPATAKVEMSHLSHERRGTKKHLPTPAEAKAELAGRRPH